MKNIHTLLSSLCFTVFFGLNCSPAYSQILYSDNFESSFGSWLNVTTGDNKNWTRDSNGTPSSGTGPLSGAQNTLYYVYLESSSGGAYVAGDSAILQGPALSSTDKFILQFNYHMYGANTGSLHVDILSNGAWMNSIWSISGQQQSSSGQPYNAVELNLLDYTVSRIRFRAVAVGGFLGDMALDEIQIVKVDLAAMDSDADGISDATDQCADTPANEQVNHNGCSLSQIDSDNDGYSDAVDAFPLDANEWIDSDMDGIGNNADTDDDNDGIIDSEDAFPLDDSEQIDTDGDGTGNNADADDDNDGLTDIDENSIHGTDPLLADTDLDQMPDGWEVQYGLNPNVHDADEDIDGDGFTNQEEFIGGSNPADPNSMPSTPIDDLSLSTTSSCAIVNNKIICWGIGTEFPIPVSLTAPQEVAHGNGAFCALQNNQVLCWGQSYNSIVSGIESSPINNALTLAVATLGSTGCVVTSANTIQCWGWNSYNLATPPNTLSNVQQVDMFQSHACSHNGITVECWGRNDNAQANVPNDLLNPIDIAVGGLHTCALQSDHQVRCWGSNSANQINVPANLGNVIRIDAGYYHTCALNDAGSVMCWGQNNHGQTTVPANLTAATRIYVGPYNTCAIANQRAVCWGQNNVGQSSIWYNLVDFDVADDHTCGINKDDVMCYGNTSNEPNLLNIPATINGPKAIGLGRYHSCVWADSGMHCWGKQSNNLNVPTGLTNVTQVEGSTNHTCAIANSNVVCWGTNTNGVLNKPTNLVNPQKLSTGEAHSCVIDGNTARCWGDNYYGQSNTRYGLVNPVAVAAGGLYPYPNSANSGHTCVADNTGVKCWGSATDGVLNVPTGLSNVTALHAGWGTSCALKSDGAVVCWGNLINGQSVGLINIGDVTKIKGRNTTVCSQNHQKLSCTNASGALLID